MPSISRNENGFASTMIYMVGIIVIEFLFIGYLIYSSPSKTSPVASSSLVPAVSVAPAASSASKTASATVGSSTSTSLQTQLDAVNAANGSNTADLNSANSGLGDQSTYTAN